MHSKSLYYAIAALFALGLLHLQADEPKKNDKPAAKKDEEVTGKIMESQKKLRDRNVRSDYTKVRHGVYILEVTTGGPAMTGHERSKNGGDIVMLEEGDIITHIDGKPVKAAEDYYKLIKGNDEKKLTVIDVNTDKAIEDYFKPVDGQLMIKFEIVTPPLG